MALLLLSNSASADGYLVHALDWMAETLDGARHVSFVPYAAVTISFDAYADRVREALAPLDVRVTSVHEAESAAAVIASSDAVLVGGGNTFHLLRLLYRHGLIDAVRKAVRGGTPFVGWSAGSNVAGPTICTTNDMPIVEPPSFEALGLVPFQINPHYTDAHPPGHRGETRAERLAEFVACHATPVVALPEGTALRVDDGAVTHLGDAPAHLFTRDTPAGRPLTDAELATLI